MPPITDVIELTDGVPRGPADVDTKIGINLIGMGAVSATAGAGMTWLVYNHPEGAHAPMPLIYDVCALFFVVGVLVAWSGVDRFLRRARDARRLREHADEPWYADYDWNPEGQRGHPILLALRGALGVIGFAMFLGPFTYIAVHDPVWFVVVIVGFFDLIALFCVGYWGYTTLRSLKFGAAFVRYDRFPFFLGDVVSVRLGCRRPLARLSKLTVTLRFVREVTETRNQQMRAVRYQHWGETRDFDPAQLVDVAELPVSFALPADPALETCLSESSAVYWEIEMKGEAPGIDLKSTFVLPVYRRA